MLCPLITLSTNVAIILTNILFFSQNYFNINTLKAELDLKLTEYNSI
jgi:low affinity Fe/Cu permease